MSWLTSFGKALKNVFTIEAKYEPTVAKILSDIPQTAAVAAGLNVFQSILGNTEALIGGGNGPQKLALAAPQVMTAIEASGFLSGKKIADLQKYQDAVTKVTSDFADMLNALEPDPAPAA